MGGRQWEWVANSDLEWKPRVGSIKTKKGRLHSTISTERSRSSSMISKDYY